MTKILLDVHSPVFPDWTPMEVSEYEILGDFLRLYETQTPPEAGVAILPQRRLTAVYRIDGIRVIERAGTIPKETHDGCSLIR
jgi:hypothetical protein